MVSYWNAVKFLSCLHEGKCASFVEHCFSLMGNCKTRKARAPEHNCVNDSQLHASVRCKVILKSEMCWTSVVVWVSMGCAQQQYCIMQNVCHMQNALVGLYSLILQTLISRRNSSWGIKHFKLLQVLLQMNASSALRIVAVTSDLF